MASKDQFETERAVFPSLSNFVERLDEQLYKSLQRLSHTSIEYLRRVQDENVLLSLCDKVVNFFNEFDQQEYSARLSIIKLTYLHYKNDSIYLKIKARLGSRATDSQLYMVENSESLIADLVSKVLKNCTPRMRTRATLLQVYHHALHNRINKARDLLQKTYMSSVIVNQIVENQVLYNRALTQIGMAYFRLGKIRESHEVLVDICQNLRFKELLAQSIGKQMDKTIDMVEVERKRLVPYHMQINLQVLDCFQYTTSMLIDIPNFADNQYSINKPMASRNFKRLIENYD